MNNPVFTIPLSPSEYQKMVEAAWVSVFFPIPAIIGIMALFFVMVFCLELSTWLRRKKGNMEARSHVRWKPTSVLDVIFPVILTSMFLVVAIPYYHPAVAPVQLLHSTTAWSSAMKAASATTVSGDQQLQDDVLQELTRRGIQVDCQAAVNREHFVCGGGGEYRVERHLGIAKVHTEGLAWGALYGDRDGEPVIVRFMVEQPDGSTDLKLTALRHPGG